MEQLSNFIAGTWHAPRGGAYLPNWHPASGTVYSLLPDSSAEDVNRAVASAQAALPGWQQRPPAERAGYLRAIATKIREQTDLLARAESRDQGKPLWLARTLDIPRAAANFDFFASAIEQHQEQCSSEWGQPLHYTSRMPVGVCGLIVPWNLPLYLLTWKIAPALAMGNTAVCKPSELTPMTAFLLSKIVAEVGLPAGVCSMVFGDGPKVGAALVEHPEVRLISFTGSTRTGEGILKAAAPSFKKVSLELGGKNPVIIFADSSWDKMLATTLRSSFLNQGEICLAGSRIYVEEAIYPRFLHDFVAQSAALRVGDPLDPDTFIGALISSAHAEKVYSYITMARQWGGRISCGGEAPRLSGACADGYFCPATVISDLPATCPVLREEIFGPVVTVAPFREVDEVIGYAHDSPYGLAATLWTSDLARAHYVASQLQVGMVWVNTWMARDLRTPFGGMKASGLGREGGRHSLEFYSEAKNICIAL